MENSCNAGSGKLFSMNRRDVLRTLAATTLCTPMLIRPATAQERRIVVRTTGGDLTQSQNEHLILPFTKETGIEVVSITSGPAPLNMIRGMVDTQTYSWDMAEISKTTALIFGDKYLEPLGLDNDPTVSMIPDHLRTPYYVPSYLYASVFGYREDRLSGDAAPKSWADFYDLAKVPGRRSLRRAALDTLESALLADGVDPAQLYPFDVDRALNKLNSLKKDIAVWWETGSQTTHLIATGEVDMVATWNQRISTATAGGTPAKIVWNQGYYTTAGWGILKGAPKADLCREFIRYTSDPQRQAAWVQKPSVGPVHPRAFDHIPADIASLLPTYPDNFRQMFPVNEAYWAENRAALEEKFDAWLLS